jgi:hypothetical protein
MAPLLITFFWGYGCHKEAITRKSAESISVATVLKTEGWENGEVFRVEETSNGFAITVDRKPTMPGGFATVHISKNGIVTAYDGGR